MRATLPYTFNEYVVLELKSYFSPRHDIAAAAVGAVVSLPQAVAYGLIATAPLGPEWAAFGILSSVGSSLLFG